MSYVLVDSSDLTTLGNAIRTKTGGSSTLTLSEMATAVSNISSGGSNQVPQKYLTFNYDLDNLFDVEKSSTSPKHWTAFIEDNIDRLTFENVTSLNSTFKCSDVSDLSDLTIYIMPGADSDGYGGVNASYCFYNMTNLIAIPSFDSSGLFSFLNCGWMFNGAVQLRSVSDFMNDNSFVISNQSRYNHMFYNCMSLREIPHLEKLGTSAAYSSCITNNGFYNCQQLRKIENLYVNTGTYSNANLFNGCATYCYMLDTFTFQTNGGTAKTASWKNGVLDLTTAGWGYPQGYGSEDYNMVSDATSYALYKNDVYVAGDVAYSRYNHDSAVATINSLPDTHSYGTNIIKFTGAAGSGTDAGAISTLTAAEIAVATNKGWTVTIV